MSGVELGFSNALSEITLVFFTTLGPSSASAYLIMLIPFVQSDSSQSWHGEIRKLLWIPFFACMLGLVASATHLGNPSNALYVFSRIGASPLSNEVFSAGAFLACAGIFWLLGFMRHENRIVDRILMCLIAFAGVAFIAMISFAYDVETILTWHIPFVPMTIAISAFVGGPLLALLSLHVAGYPSKGRILYRVLAFISAIASTLWIALNAAFGIALRGISNSLFSASELIPLYFPCLAIATILLAGAFIIAELPLICSGRCRIIPLAVGVSLSFIAIFIMRFMFYMAHLTVGLAV